MRRKQQNVSVMRTPIDTLDQAINDIDRQTAQLNAAVKVNERLKEGLLLAKEKAQQAFANQHINLLPRPEQTDFNRQIGFLGAGLAARAIEVLESHGHSLHIDDLYAVVSSMPGLASLTKESLRGTLNSDARRKYPRVINLGEAIYDLATRHTKQKRLKAA